MLPVPWAGAFNLDIELRCNTGHSLLLMTSKQIPATYANELMDQPVSQEPVVVPSKYSQEGL